MAHNLKLADVAANAGLAAVTALLDGGFLKIFAGARPATANAALGGATLLAMLTFSSPAFAAPVAGLAAAHAIASDPSMAATGTPTFARLFQSDGVTAVLDVSVGLSDADLTFDSLAFVAGQICQIAAWSLRLPE